VAIDHRVADNAVNRQVVGQGHRSTSSPKFMDDLEQPLSA
jgi:hypothetical protein